MNNSYNNYKDFLAEAEDILRDLNVNLYVLKSKCNSTMVHDPEVVNELFREIHTLKGISEATGFPRISSLSHRLEDLLDCLRFGRIELSFDVVDTLFEIADIFTELLKNINEQGIEYAEIGPAVEKIGNLLNDSMQEDRLKNNCFAGIPPGLSGNLSEFEQYRFVKSLNEGRRIYSIIVCMHIDSIDEEMARLRAHLTSSGEIISVIPASGFSADDKVSFELVYSQKIPLNPPFSKGENGFPPLEKGDIISIQEIESENPLPDNNDREQNTDAVETIPQSARSIAKTVRVDIEKLEVLLNAVGEILLLNSSVTHSMKELKIKYGQNLTFLDLNRSARLLHKKIALLRDGLIDIRLVPVEYLFSRLYRIVELLSKDLSKKIRFEVSGGDTRLDKSIIEELADPLMHIIRNAISHGIEDEAMRKNRGKGPEGTVKIKAVQRDSSVMIDIKDDGGGIDLNEIYNRALGMGLIRADEKDEKRLLSMIFMPGFTTKSIIDDVSGRGVGLDVVARNIENLSGMIEVETEYGKGTTFRITLPVTLLIVTALIVSESGREFAIPVNSVSENISLKKCEIRMIRDKECINLRGDYLPLVRLKDVLKYPGGHEESPQKNKYVIIVNFAGKKMGIIVDKIYGQREILIKPPGQFLKEIQCVAGFAEIDARKVVPVVDIAGLLDRTLHCMLLPEEDHSRPIITTSQQ